MTSNNNERTRYAGYYRTYRHVLSAGVAAPTTTHTDLDDVSIYSDLAKIRRVPIDALTSWTDRTVNGEPIREIVEPTRLDGFSALVNKATGDLLQTRPVADTYKLVSHDELFSLQAQDGGGLRRCRPRQLSNYRPALRWRTRVHRTIMFHDLDAVVGNSDDRVVCRMDVFNSVDMSWSFQIFSGAYRDLCRNTLVFGGEKAYHQKRKHTKNLSPAALIGKATMGLDFWQNNRDEMDRMRQTPLTRDQFGLILANTICKPSRGQRGIEENRSRSTKGCSVGCYTGLTKKPQNWAKPNGRHITRLPTGLPTPTLMQQTMADNKRKRYQRNEQGAGKRSTGHLGGIWKQWLAS